MNAAKAIAYYRVSTQRQGVSGLGLEAQRSTVTAFAKARGLELAGEFTEVETGTGKRERPVLMEAIEAAKGQDAVLLIAKLDRLSRNVHFVSGLKESKVRFVACDLPDVNDTTIYVMAAVAEAEAKAISERTRAALAAAKARGVRLGNPGNLSDEGRREALRVRQDLSARFYSKVSGYVASLRRNGYSLRAIADQLNNDGYRTRREKRWTASQVQRVLVRYAPSAREGVSEGVPEDSAGGLPGGARANRERATRFYRDYVDQLRARRAHGETLQQIADYLNAQGKRTRTGKEWTFSQVHRVLTKYVAQEAHEGASGTAKAAEVRPSS